MDETDGNSEHVCNLQKSPNLAGHALPLCPPGPSAPHPLLRLSGTVHYTPLASVRQWV